MNPRAVDLYVRSLTTAALAVLVVLIAGYQIVHTGTVDTAVGSFVGLVLGFYFGAHVSQNGASARARQDELVVESATGNPAPRDPLAPIQKQPSE